MPSYPEELLELIAYLQKLPGVGRKTAERFAFHLLDWKNSDLQKLSGLLGNLKDRIKFCATCGAIQGKMGCAFCTDSTRDGKILCVVAHPKDVYAIEETRSFRGLYHILGTLLSPMEGKTPEVLKMDHLLERLHHLNTKELILALDSTVEGDTTALFLKESLLSENRKVSRLALGLPMGSSLDFVDGGTLQNALMGRQVF